MRISLALLSFAMLAVNAVADQAPVVIGGEAARSESVLTRAAPSGVTFQCADRARSRLGFGDTLKRSDTRSIRQVVGARCGSSRSVGTRSGFTPAVPNRLYVVSLSPAVAYSGSQLTLWKQDGTYVNGPAVARPGFPNNRWTADFGCLSARRMYQRLGGNLVMQVIRRNGTIECYNVCSTSVTIRNGRVQAADARTRESGESGVLPAECRASRSRARAR